jgi:hypothetical protein
MLQGPIAGEDVVLMGAGAGKEIFSTDPTGRKINGPVESIDTSS